MKKILNVGTTSDEIVELQNLNDKLQFLLPKPQKLPDEVRAAIKDAKRLPK